MAKGEMPTASQFNTAGSGFKDFAQTGGFTPSNIDDFRARAIAPTRAIYSNMQDELARNKTINGANGYTPGFGAAMSRIGREGNQAISDVNQNANAQLGQLIQQGRLYGLTGMSSNAAAQQSAENAYARTPGFFSQLMGGLGSGLGLAGTIAGGLTGLSPLRAMFGGSNPGGAYYGPENGGLA